MNRTECVLGEHTLTASRENARHPIAPCKLDTAGLNDNSPEHPLIRPFRLCIHCFPPLRSDLPLGAIGADSRRAQITLPALRRHCVLGRLCRILDFTLDVPRGVLGLANGRFGAVLGIAKSRRERRAERRGGRASGGRTALGRGLRLREDLGARKSVRVERDVALHGQMRPTGKSAQCRSSDRS